jgi:hypothetical protein
MTDTTKPVAVKALERIARWHGEFPETGQFWDDEKTRPISYGAAFGSNGERDFMRKIASDALAQIAAPSPQMDLKGAGMREPLQDDISPESKALLARLTSMHPDDRAVEMFSFFMTSKLAQKREEGRGGWQDKELCSGEYLSQLLREHVGKGDPIDVANFCMMLHQRGERISPSPQATEATP